MPSHPYYIEKTAGFSTKMNDVMVTPLIFQPTPEGVNQLCRYYTKKYNIDLRCVDLRGLVESGDNALHFFTYLQNNPGLLSVEEGQARGLVLSHGQFHAIPVLVCKQWDIQHIIVFDSSSGCRTPGYYKMAQLFPNAHFYLNAGTRQSDEGSCITDAICILKEALQVDDLLLKIRNKISSGSPVLSNPNRFLTVSKPSNFNLFKMPEHLLVTAQVSKYLVEANADLSVIIRGGYSLAYFREKFVLQVSLMKNEGMDSEVTINSYLYIKSKEHKLILDYLYKKSQSWSNVINELSLDTPRLTSPTRYPTPLSTGFIPVNALPQTESSSPRMDFFSR